MRSHFRKADTVFCSKKGDDWIVLTIFFVEEELILISDLMFKL